MIEGRIAIKPRPHQLAVLQSRKRHRAVNMHRRAGKTVTAILAALECQMTCKLPSPRIFYISPFLKQSKKLAWDYLASITQSGGDHFSINRSELTTTFKHNDGRIILAGADNIDSLRGVYCDLAIVDEVADVDPNLWGSVLRPALADRKGRALIMGTPKGRMNMLYDLSLKADDPDWQYFQYDYTQTDMLDAAEVEAMRREMSEAMFEQEMLCSFNAALIGAVYGKEMNALQAEGRFSKVAYDRQWPVFTAWDLGWRDATAVWFCQMIGNQVHVIDYREFAFQSLVEIAQEIRNYDYEYAGMHYGPHDLYQHELGSGNSRADILSRFGFNFNPPVNWPLEDGIEAMRAMLPNVWIDGDKCRRLLECLVNYKYDVAPDGVSYKTKPAHNWSSHGCDAGRMLAVALDKSIRPSATSRKRRGDGDQGWLI